MLKKDNTMIAANNQTTVKEISKESVMMRYAIITKVEVYSGEDKIGEVNHEDASGFKAKLEDQFMSGDDIAFVGKVLEYLGEDGDLAIEEEI